MVRNKPDWRAWYYPGRETVRVEFSLPKLLFGTNSLNYALSPFELGRLVSAAGDSFFAAGSYFVSRCDLGFVVYYDNYSKASSVVDTFRQARLPGARKNSYQHQNYADSVFYKSTNWSIKIYNKGLEQGVTPGWPNDYLLGALRAEKTFRSREMARLGMECVPFNGIPINSFSVQLLYDNLVNVFSGWQRKLPTHIPGLTGQLGLLSILDRMGQLSQVESAGLTSKSTLHRYNKAKAEFVPDLDFDIPTSPDKNFNTVMRRQLAEFLNFGLQIES